LQANQFLRGCSYPTEVIAAPPKVDPHIAAIDPAQARKRLRECGKETLSQGIVFVARHEQADAPHAPALLRPPDDWPRRGAAKSCDKLSPIH
jgi:hypothetical protein